MRDRILVKVSASEYCIHFKTVSWRRKSPRTFSKGGEMQLHSPPFVQSIHHPNKLESGLFIFFLLVSIIAKIHSPINIINIAE